MNDRTHGRIVAAKQRRLAAVQPVVPVGGELPLVDVANLGRFSSPPSPTAQRRAGRQWQSH
jgi:hypothetical protein